MHVRLSTERLDQDEKFRDLVTRFVDAKLELVEYLNSKMDFAFERVREESKTATGQEDREREFGGTIPRMRTAAKIVAEIKAMDPGSEVTEYYIRQIIKDGAVPVVWAGNKAFPPFVFREPGPSGMSSLPLCLSPVCLAPLVAGLGPLPPLGGFPLAMVLL